MPAYWKRCPVCKRMFELSTPEEPLPRHDRLDEPDLYCIGGGREGELVSEEDRAS